MGIDLKNIKKIDKKEKPINQSKSNNQIFAFLNKDISLFGTKLKDIKKERFYSEIGILLASGIDIKTSLDIIVDEQTKSADKELFESINNRVLNGDSLSEAINYTNKFSPYEYYSLKIGEESGKMNEVLNELTTFYSKKIKQKRQLTNAFSYPVLVLFIAIAAVVFMMNYMVPMFVDVFTRFQGDLPGITKTIVNISNFTSEYFIWFFVLVIILIVVYLFVKKKNWYRNISSKILLKFPILGNIVKMIYLERFCQSMALLIGSKNPMLNSIKLIGNMISFYPFEKALNKIEEDILIGKSLNESMAKFSLFDKRMISLVKVGEEVNQLDTIFSKLNKQYSDELEHKISLISSMLEPILIIFIGLIVGVILIAMYLPMFQLSTSIY
ncbi:MAG: type II secretion system F family protein [Bacteroidales bacterium]|nr:type II secretion system F family protein [Bacteroidales bacterium]